MFFDFIELYAHDDGYMAGHSSPYPAKYDEPKECEYRNKQTAAYLECNQNLDSARLEKQPHDTLVEGFALITNTVLQGLNNPPIRYRG